MPENETMVFLFDQLRVDVGRMSIKMNEMAVVVDSIPAIDADSNNEDPMSTVGTVASIANKKSNASMVVSILIALAFVAFVAFAVSGCANEKRASDPDTEHAQAAMMTRPPATRAHGAIGTGGIGGIGASVGGDQFDAAVEAMYSTVAEDAQVRHVHGTEHTIVNPTYDTSGPAHSSIGMVRLVQNVLYTGSTAEGGGGVGSSETEAVVEASSVAGIPAVYIVPMESENANPSAPSTSAATYATYAPAAAAPPSNMHDAGSARDQTAGCDQSTAPTASDAQRQLGHQHTVAEHNSGYVNTSYEVMAAAVSVLPAMTRSDAESKLATANVDGGFLLRQKKGPPSSASSNSNLKVVVSSTSKGVHEHYVMELVEDADKRGAQWKHRSQLLPNISMIDAATTLLKDKLVHSDPQLLSLDEGGTCKQSPA